MSQRAATRKTVEQPAFLRGARHRASGVEALGAVADLSRRRLGRPVLPGVEQWNVARPPQRTRRYSRMSWPVGIEPPSQRHVLVVGPQRRGPALRKPAADSDGTAPAQLSASSWSSNTASHGAAACAACRSGSDLYWAYRLSVVGERHGLAAGVTATSPVCPRRVLVLVIAKVQNKIRVLIGEVAVCGEPALLVVRARREAHRQRRMRAERGCCAGASRG